jgi:hypothetical protein
MCYLPTRSEQIFIREAIFSFGETHQTVTKKPRESKSQRVSNLVVTLVRRFNDKIKPIKSLQNVRKMNTLNLGIKYLSSLIFRI